MNETVDDEALLLLLKKMAVQLEIQLEHHLREEDLSGVQVYLMVHILRHHPNGTYITGLCNEIGVSKTTMSLLIKKLREKDYLSFQKNGTDDQKKQILLTNKLRQEAAAFLAKADGMEQEICSNLGMEERKQLMMIEQKILDRCCQMEIQRKR